MIIEPGTYRQYPPLTLIKFSLQCHCPYGPHMLLCHFKPFAIHVTKRDIVLCFLVQNVQV